MSASKDLFYEAKNFYQAKNYQRALKLYKKLSGLHPNDYNVWNNLGLCHARLYDYKKAIVAFEKAVEVTDKKQLIWSNLGKAYYHFGDFNSVIKTYKRALKVFPYNTFYWNGIGVMCIKLSKYEIAIKFFKHTLDIDDQNRTAWDNLCIAYGKMGVDFSSTSFEPNSEVSWYQLSKALLVSSLYEDSFDAIKRALLLNPSFHDAVILKIKITLMIKENEKLKTVQNSDMNRAYEKDLYYERFIKLQEKRRSILNKPEFQKYLTLEERFKKLQEKFKERSMQIEDTIDFKTTKPVKNVKHVKPQKKGLEVNKFIFVNHNYQKADENHFVIDGANVARDGTHTNKGGKISRFYNLFEKLTNLGITKYTILCDRSLYHTIDKRKEYKHLIENENVSETPGGTEADHFILQIAKENNSYIISNDRFREFENIFGKEWLNKHRITFTFNKEKMYFDKIYPAY